MISVEALVAQIGVIPGKDEMLTKEDGRAAVAIEELWRGEVRAWLEQKKPKRFKLCTQYPFEKTLNLLTSDLPPDLFSQMTQPAVVDECRQVLDRARAYALTKWPVRYLDRPERQGGLLLQPGQIELMGACAILAVLDDPDRMLEELRMETLEDSQVEAFKACFPDLYRMLVAITWDEIDRRALDGDYYMPWPTELILRRLIQLPPEMSITKAERPPPEAGKPSISAPKFDKLQTKAQRLEDR